MDAENGELFFQHGEEDGAPPGETWSLDAPFTISNVMYTGSEKTMEEWKVGPHCGMKDNESEDVLHAINPNDVFPSGPPAETESDGDGSEEEPCTKTSAAMITLTQAPATVTQAPATIYQVVYDISTLANVKEEPEQHSVDVISIELDEWSSQMLISESCIVNELPLVSAGRLDHDHTPAAYTAPSSPDSPLLYPDLQLTDEEHKLLSQEGVSLPNNLPLTKAEERILKKVRRKIRNKQSAQDSRRRKKEYVDGLENRAAACSAQNKELQRTVEQLEKHNMSLLAQLRRLQSLIKQTVSKGAQTSTCVLIIVFSLGLIIFPSYSPFSWSSDVDEDYSPTGVISRNILTDPASSLPTTDEGDTPAAAVQPDSLQPPPDLQRPPDLQPDPLHSSPVPKPAEDSAEITDFEAVVLGEVLTEVLPGNDSAVEDSRTTDPLALGLVLATGKGAASLDPSKPAHADEM